MRYYRLVKPLWGLEEKANGDPNPKFKRGIPGFSIIEGYGFSQEYLKEQNELGYSVYYFPNCPKVNPYSKELRFLNGRLIDNFNFAFADIDFKDGVFDSLDSVMERLSEFPFAPTSSVLSGHGVHLYFQIEDLTRESYICAQLKLIEFFKSDSSVYTCLQLMRCPGYLNTKQFENYSSCVELIGAMSSRDIYSAKEFLSKLPQLSCDSKLKAKSHLDRLDGKLVINVSEDIDLSALPEKFIQLLQDKPRIFHLFNDPSAGGDRSTTDMVLAHLLHSEGYNYKEVFAIIANSQKALEKGGDRLPYTRLTVDKVFIRRKVGNFQSVSEFLRDEDSEILEPEINGPYHLDSGVLGNVWRRKEVLGLISGPGTGKTAFALNTILDTIKNNSDSDDIYVFFSLEMTRGQIINRWVAMVGESSPLADRLYVLDTKTADGKQRMIGLQEVYEACEEIKQFTGCHIGMLVIDHLHIMSTHIDIKVTPDFGIGAEGGTGYGNIRNLTINQLTSQLKTLSVLLDSFLIILAQTTKEKGRGDTPIYKDGCYGISNYDWICDRIITLWQPLLRVQNQTELRILAFQYAKIRELHTDDRVKIYEPKLLTYDMISGRLGGTTPDEYQEFLTMLPHADSARKASIKGEGFTYSVV